MNQKNFFEFSFQDFKHFLNKDVEIEDKKVSMRTKQIWQSVYKKGSFEISNLTTLPIELRNKLNNLISLQRPKIINTQTSSDGTIKWLIQLFDGNEVECVYIPEKTRATLCISSQVGCTLNCRFCHTGERRPGGQGGRCSSYRRGFFLRSTNSSLVFHSLPPLLWSPASSVLLHHPVGSSIART